MSDAIKEEEVTAESLRAIRKRLGIRQNQVASWIGGNASTISKIENGGRHLTPAEKTILNWHLLGVKPF
jgi:transcriptional regulator with XRE-family HTH domain